jgi:uncharacterized protein YuzE
MRVTFDAQADMAYVYLVQGYIGGGAVRQVLAGDDKDTTTVLDYDAGGRLVGIELFTASRQLHPDLQKIAEH